MDTDSSEEDACSQETSSVRIPLGHQPVVFTLPGSRDLADRAVALLGWRRGQCTFSAFGNGEIRAKVDESVTNHDVFVFFARDDLEAEVNYSIMQLLLFIAALKGESPHRLTVVMPCLEYARQDRKLVAGQAISPRLLLRCMKTAGADRFLTAALHNEAEVAFAPESTVLDDLGCTRYLAEFIRATVDAFDPEKTMVCATSGGGMKETRRMADELRTGFMLADHMRPKAGGVGEVKIMSSGVENVEAIIVVDDIFDTCGSLAKVCRAVHHSVPCAKIYGVATHGYQSGDAHIVIKELVDTCNLQWIAVTNSVTQRGALQRFSRVGLEDRLKVVDISRLLAGAIMRIHLGCSVNLSSFKALGPSDVDKMLQGSPFEELRFARQTSPERSRVLASKLSV